MERRLGRGLGSLLAANSADEGGVQKIDTQRVRPNPHQPRQAFEPQALEELRQSIETHGVLQPILVRRVGEGFELIAGERRWRASQMAGLQLIPAVVRQDVKDSEMLELALVENLQRRDLDPMEKASGYRRMMEELGLTQEGVATKVGLQRTTVTNHLRLLELPEQIQDGVRGRQISMGHARAILGLGDEASQLELMDEAVREGLSVREVERRARERVAKPATSDPKPDLRVSDGEEAIPAWVQEIEARLREALGMRVNLAPGEGEQGRLSLEFHDHRELERLLELLAPKQDVL
ncbi:MAG: ParB family chromosome partitioning protein [Planctomycetota bacterium]|jgi:ParB family chromosome partitioning protein